MIIYIEHLDFKEIVTLSVMAANYSAQGDQSGKLRVFRGEKRFHPNESTNRERHERHERWSGLT
jgi:hypothetical protein